MERGRSGAAAFAVGTTLPSMPASASALAVGGGAAVSSAGLRAMQSERRQTHPTSITSTHSTRRCKGTTLKVSRVRVRVRVRARARVRVRVRVST